MSSYLADRISLDYTGFFFDRKENFFFLRGKRKKS